MASLQTFIFSAPQLKISPWKGRGVVVVTDFVLSSSWHLPLSEIIELIYLLQLLLPDPCPLTGTYRTVHLTHC